MLQWTTNVPNCGAASRERPHSQAGTEADLVRPWPDNAAGRFGHLVPGSAEVAERLGDDDAGLGAQPIQDLDLWVKLPQLGHVGGVEQDLVRPSLE